MASESYGEHLQFEEVPTDVGTPALFRFLFPVGGCLTAQIPMNRRDAEELMHQMVFILGYKLAT